MSKRPGDGHRLAWRGPWLTREDRELLATLPEAIAIPFERLLHRQARSDRRYAAMCAYSRDDGGP